MKLSYLKRIQNEAGYTLCAIREDFIFTSHARGIAPIMDQIRRDPLYFHDCVVCDTIIGKAAAMMFVRSKVSYLHAKVMSEAAHALLQRYEIAHSYDELCPYIINRKQNGMCPMEMCVQEMEDLQGAYDALEKTLQHLRQAQ